MASNIEIHHIIPTSVYDALALDIDRWTNGEFEVDAVYNLVPVAADDNVAGATAGGSPLHYNHRELNSVLLQILRDIRDNANLTDVQRGAEFKAIQSYFRQALDYSPTDGETFNETYPTFLNPADPAAQAYLAKHEYAEVKSGTYEPEGYHETAHIAHIPSAWPLDVRQIDIVACNSKRGQVGQQVVEKDLLCEQGRNIEASAMLTMLPKLALVVVAIYFIYLRTFGVHPRCGASGHQGCARGGQCPPPRAPHPLRHPQICRHLPHGAPAHR